MGVLEVEVELKEDEHVVLSVLEIEVEFKEEEKEEHVIWGCWRSRLSSRRMNMWICLCWRLRGSSMRKRRKNR